MATKGAGGRPSLYGPKTDTKRLQALAMTREGRKQFEQWRRHVKVLNKWPGRVSDGDVIEFLVRR